MSRGWQHVASPGHSVSELDADGGAKGARITDDGGDQPVIGGRALDVIVGIGQIMRPDGQVEFAIGKLGPQLGIDHAIGRDHAIAGVGRG